MSDHHAPFSAVLFDCDGVLVDSEPITNRVLHGMLHELGWEITDEECVRRFIGRGLKDEWRIIEQHTGVRIDEAWLDEFRERRNEALRGGLEAVDGIFEAIEGVRERVGDRFACVTGADRAKVEFQLRATGLDRAFGNRVFSGMEVARTKPAPDVYLAAADSLGVDPATVAVVEDSVAGVTAGVAAGASVFGFTPDGPTSTSPAALVAAGAVTTFTAMGELPSLLDRLRRARQQGQGRGHPAR
ncbi:HAD family hydrolase [Agromyces laixinhei]|uniref:HAD family hydrolase n=1 Tax=Agromyces laixinhei TaxID=2585717 RepID=UPI0011174CD0|nr:HAD family phosphatase [Agromyces laixinhei]